MQLLRDGIPVLLTLVAASMLADLSVWELFRSTSALFGQGGRPMLLAMFGRKWGGIFALFPLTFAGSLLCDPASSLAVFLGVAAIPVVLLAYAAAYHLPGRSLPPVEVVRGDLRDALSAIYRRNGYSGPRRLYVVPNGCRQAPDALIDIGEPAVYVPVRLLDRLSRAEIDSLMLLQWRLPNLLYRRKYAFLYALTCFPLACIFLDHFRPGLGYRWQTLLCLAILEVPLIAWVWRRENLRLCREIAAASSNADDLVSALAAVSELSTGQADSPLIRRIASVAASKPDALLAQRQRPAEDRYPTHGDYSTVGFEL
jgi:hypothetical protein